MRERIIQASEDEIIKRGLKFSIRDVAKLLGISTKTVYQYVESKESIIGAIVERSISEMRNAEKEIMGDSSLSLRHKLHQTLALLPRGFVFQDIHILEELKQRYPAQWQEVDNYVRKGWDNIRLLVEEGVATGEIREFDLELFIQVYIGAFYHLMEHRHAARNGLSLEKALGQMVDLLLVGIYKEGTK
ncbi:hypothetical protein GCM10010912_09910 [Paenibacillus albidus]|uniref:HTH tetR-type domain-containing protein n=1 Tax=Paenibacillus albidus TaxID=2041023 RepID=A0A917C3C2_9BACL|nr:TetR/AcrR family transcriptional regulator [Paenibacillus albidus]GGF66940.1 hypothetical protein GCM10010912_09910 [Paenibacillus albidus]